MGTPDFAAVALKTLYLSHEEIVCVVTQPDRPTGRHALVTPSKVKVEASKLGLNVIQPEKASDPEFIEKIRMLKPDAIVVAAYGKILKKELLDIPRYGCINIHASLLPRWRGAAPVAWAIIAGDEISGVSIMQMSEGVDTGDILLTKSIYITKDETSASLFKKLSFIGADLIDEALKKLEKGELKPIKQDNRLATYAPMLKKEMGHIDWNMTAIRIERRIRGFFPWPGAFTYSNGKLIKIISASLYDGFTKPPEAYPTGTILTESGRMFVKCLDCWLEILKLQPSGKNVMNATDFLRGNRITKFDN